MIGAGSVAERHVSTLGEFDDVTVVGVADVDEARASALAESCGARAFDSYESMIGDQGLDAAYICVPPFAHGAPEHACLDAGLPMFVEKPIAVDLETAEEIAAAVRERHLITAVGYHWRYLDIVERARGLLADRPPRLAVAYWLDKVPPPGWWIHHDRSGGQIVEQTTHVLDLLRYVAGEVSEVYARDARTQRPAYPDSDIADVTAATLSMANGAVGSVVSTCLLPGKQRAGLDLIADGLSLQLSEEELTVRDGDESSTHRPQAAAKWLVDRDFIDAVKGGESSIRAPYEEALTTQRLACAVAASAANGNRPRAVSGNGERGELARSLGVERAGKAAFFDVALDEPGDGSFRVETLYTGLSAGTELTFFKGTHPYLESFPVEKMGYMEVGRVATHGGPAAPQGRLVAMAYGHKTAHTAHPDRDRFVLLPEELDPVLGVFVAHMGPICANGLLHAAADLVGPDVRSLGDGVRGLNVLVMGAGVVGLLTALFAVHHGAASVTVADAGERRLAAARGLGLETIDRRHKDVGSVLKARHRAGFQDRGADVVFQCRGRTESLAEALRSLRPQGTVIDMAFYTEGAPDLNLGEEFHHKGLSIRCAQIGRVPRGLAPLWHRDRLSAETLELLLARGDDVRRELITDVVALESAPQVIEDLAERRREDVQIVFAAEAAAQSADRPGQV